MLKYKKEQQLRFELTGKEEIIENVTIADHCFLFTLFVRLPLAIIRAHRIMKAI